MLCVSVVQTIPEVVAYFGVPFVYVHTRCEAEVHGEGAFSTTRPMASCHRGQRISVTPSPGNLLLPHHCFVWESTCLLVIVAAKNVGIESLRARDVCLGALGCILVDS